MTDVFQIALPHSTNRSVETPTFRTGADYIHYADQRKVWENYALHNAGGFTYLGERRGVWQDGETLKVYEETMHWYEVACERSWWDNIVHKAFQLFPDQKAFYTAKVGECEIIEAPAVVGGE